MTRIASSTSPPDRAFVVVGASDPSLARLAREMLGADGHDVAVAPNAASLVARFDEDVPDLVLLAFEGMEADGFSACRELRRLDAHVPVLLLAARSDGDSLIASAFAAGADDLVLRPVHWDLLRHRVRALLRSGQLVSELRTNREILENAQRIARLGSWELEVDSQRMRWSSQTFRVLGFEPGEVKTNLENFALCIHPEDRSAVTRHLEDSLEAGRPFDVSHRVVLPSGGVRFVQLRGEQAPSGRVVQGSIQDVTEERRAQDKIRHLAHYDSLTGLSNRRRFKEQLDRAIERARSRSQQMALLYMDLDQFKRINDTLGHSAGDHLLRHVAQVLFEKVRATDIIGRVGEEDDVEISRLGGDEFAVVLSPLEASQCAGQVAERILSSVTAPITYEGHPISTTASVGIAVFPQDGDDSEALVKHADTAMYVAKERGRNTYQFFSGAMNAGTLRRMSLEAQLRVAVAENSLRVLYQPRLDLAARRVTGMEALLRFDHPQLGPVLPKEFIPVAEETGLIIPIGEWVLHTACSQAKSWRVDGYGKVRVSVNVSSRQFVQHDLVGTVSRALRDTGLDPRQLELEVTESVVLEDDENTGRMLAELKAMGVRIALDDFGTGYSSLSYLTRFPLDTLKLDRSLVRDVGEDPAARGIATAVISMAHVVGLAVTAEGVDAVEQARSLRDEGCDELQGFLLAGPIPADECPPYFAERVEATPIDWSGIFGEDG